MTSTAASMASSLFQTILNGIQGGTVSGVVTGAVFILGIVVYFFFKSKIDAEAAAQAAAASTQTDQQDIAQQNQASGTQENKMQQDQATLASVEAQNLKNFLDSLSDMQLILAAVKAYGAPASQIIGTSTTLTPAQRQAIYGLYGVANFSPPSTPQGT